MPGEYRVSLSRRVDGVITELAPPVPLTVTAEHETELTPEQRKAMLAYREKVSKLQRAFAAATEVLDNLNTRIDAIKQAVQDTPKAPQKLRQEAVELEERLREISEAWRGDNTSSILVQPAPLTIAQRISDVTFTMLSSPQLPTQTRLDSYKVAAEAFGEQLAKLRVIFRQDMPKLEKALDAAGVPHTPGRLPEWKDG